MNSNEESTTPPVKIRPVTATILTIVQAIWTTILIHSLNPIGIAIGLISLLVTVGLWRGQNAAWALLILGSVISLVLSGLSLDIIGILSALVTLGLALTPNTRSYYKPDEANRSQLSMRPKGILQLLGILLVGMVVIFFIAVQMA